jgi:hypothetical protein
MTARKDGRLRYRYKDIRRKDCRWNYGELRECTYMWTKKANKEREIQKAGR